MKKMLSVLMGTVLVAVAAFPIAACTTTTNQLFYPDYGYADTSSDSWLQRDDEVITVTWYVDSSTYSINQGVRDAILKYTGIELDFQRPPTDDGDKLTTLLAGDMPDVITITDDMTRVQLEQANRVYPLQELAERYAPTLLERVDDEIWDFYQGKDGYTYCLPNNFYTTTDLALYEGQGEQLQTNGVLVVRKDYLEAYLNSKSSDPDFRETDISTPDGFIAMCEWVKQTYSLSNANPTFLMDQFTTMQMNNSISFLAEYFCVPPEDEEGNLTYQPAEEKYREMLMFLNEMYRKGIISSSNFSANATQIGTYIQRGMPFACLLPTQNYTVNFKRFIINENQETEYVPILLTNYDGDIPQLRNLAGNGLRLSMITSDCAHPERVIKLFDFLYSAEGQRLMYFGVEGETFEYDVQPGETAVVDGEEVTYEYGKVSWTADAWDAIQNNDYTDLGVTLLGQGFLWNPMLIRLMHPEGDLVNDYAQYVGYNLKAAVTPYTYNYKGLRYALDPLDSGYVNMITLETSLERVWIEYIPRIIMADTQEEAGALYQDALDSVRLLGYESWLEYQNTYFRQYKENNDIAFAWPPNDASSGYSSLTLVSPFGDTSLVKELPENLRIA